VNVPIGVVALVAVTRLVPELRSAQRQRLDLAGPPRHWRGVTGLSHQTVSRWETGADFPSSHYFDALCRLYHTRPDRLGFGHDYSAMPSTTHPDGAEQPQPDALVEARARSRLGQRQETFATVRRAERMYRDLYEDLCQLIAVPRR